MERTLIMEYEQVEDARERIEAERDKYHKAQLELRRARARRDGSLAEFELMLAYEEAKRKAAVDAATANAPALSKASTPSASGAVRARVVACPAVSLTRRASQSWRALARSERRGAHAFSPLSTLGHCCVAHRRAKEIDADKQRTAVNSINRASETDARATTDTVRRRLVAWSNRSCRRGESREPAASGAAA